MPLSIPPLYFCVPVDAGQSVYAAILSTLAGAPFDVITQLVSVGQNCPATHLADLLWLVGVRVCCSVHT
jgi:hypothetical protein